MKKILLFLVLLLLSITLLISGCTQKTQPINNKIVTVNNNNLPETSININSSKTTTNKDDITLVNNTLINDTLANENNISNNQSSQLNINNYDNKIENPTIQFDDQINLIEDDNGDDDTANTDDNEPVTSEDTNNYRWHTQAYTTQFFFGSSESYNGAAWNTNIVIHYGGIDNPFNRNGYYPQNFTPNENPFYAALPYSDISSQGNRRKNAQLIPWYDESLNYDESYIKNRWIEINFQDQTCYAQLEDCGPVAAEHLECDDFDYVFGEAQQPTTYPEVNIRPALDISPATSDCLGLDDPTDLVYGHGDDYTSWKFIDEVDVPDGPWKEIITVSQINWDD